MQLSRKSPPALAVALSGNTGLMTPSTPRRQLMQARRSAHRQGRTAVRVSALTMTQIDLAAEPLPSNQFFISTYNDTNRFGKQLTEMKELIKASGNFRSEDEKRICLALAMQEDSLMAAHDASKDGLGLAANYGIYNLSGDMLQCAGYSGNGNLNSKEEQTKWNWSLNHLKEATDMILDYLRGDAPRQYVTVHQPAAASALNFIRGGRSGYDGNAPQGHTKEDWDASNLLYRRAIATMVDQMAKDYTLMGDNRRINIAVFWQ